MQSRFSATAPLTSASAAPEHRGAYRYELSLELTYEIYNKNRRSSQTGRGQTSDISNRSLRFTPRAPLPDHSEIELSIDWPAKVDESLPLSLSVVGTVVRRGPRGVVVLIRRYAFVPAATSAIPDLPGGV
jgi:hypothetical protein